ncbi:MAG: hypothetical protein DGJ47_000253 [Rickettsiaceae bacterium]
MPILYSFRRCPYAMRARMVLHYSGIECDIREVDLKNKPAELLKTSPKGTVPVMVLDSGEIIDESMDVIKYAITVNDPENIGSSDFISQIDELVETNDTRFAKLLRQYKYPDRYPEINQLQIRAIIEEEFLFKYENMLSEGDFLLKQKTIADYAIIPFIRQFAYVDDEWFFSSKYFEVIKWLQSFLETEEFENIIMQKRDIWVDNTQ